MGKMYCFFGQLAAQGLGKRYFQVEPTVIIAIKRSLLLTWLKREQRKVGKKVHRLPFISSCHLGTSGLPSMTCQMVGPWYDRKCPYKKRKRHPELSLLLCEHREEVMWGWRQRILAGDRGSWRATVLSMGLRKSWIRLVTKQQQCWKRAVYKPVKEIWLKPALTPWLWTSSL